MIETTLKIDGMMCAMCESHVADAIRNALRVKKVKADHKKGEAVVLSEEELDEQALRQAVEKTGYRVLSLQVGEQQKRGLFGRR